MWYIGGKKRKQQGGAIPIGLIASVAGPILGEIAKPILKKIVGGKINKKTKRRCISCITRSIFSWSIFKEISRR